MLMRFTAAATASFVATASSANILFDNTVQRLDYTTADAALEDQLFLDIDVDGDEVEDFTFTILNSTDDTFLGGLDFSRNGGFIGDFDANDVFIFRTFDEGDIIGPDLEFDIGFETFGFAEYDSFGDTGGGLASTSAIIGFGIATSGEDSGGNEVFGNIYGWMSVTFGELRATEPLAPSNTFIEVTGVALNTALDGAIAAGQIPEPAGMGLLAIGAAGLLTVRRRK